MTPPKPMIAVLGLGEMGLIHALNLSKQRGIRLALVSTRESALSETATSLHADKTYSSYEAAIADPDVVAVVISTPPPSHPDLIISAARANKHIFCEKPLGYDSETIASAVEEVEKSGVRFMSGFNRRFDRDYAAAYAKVNNGELGPPTVLRCTSGDPEYPEKYHRGGADNAILMDLAVHDIDLARWFCASEVKQVYAVVDAMTYPSLKEKDGDVVVAVLQMESGAKVIFHLSRAFWFGYDVTTQLFCKNGMLDIGELKKTAVTTLQDRQQATDIAWHFGERFESAFEQEMAAFATLVLADTATATKLLNNGVYPTAEDGLRATCVSEALVRSSKSGMPQAVQYIKKE